MFGFDQGGWFGQVVYDEGGLGVSVVHGSKRCETFLAGGIPYLELDCTGRQGAFLGQEGSCLRVGVRQLDTQQAALLREKTAAGLPPIVGSLFSWKSLFTNRRTRDDYLDDDNLVSWRDGESAAGQKRRA